MSDISSFNIGDDVILLRENKIEGKIIRIYCDKRNEVVFIKDKFGFVHRADLRFDNILKVLVE